MRAYAGSLRRLLNLALFGVLPALVMVSLIREPGFGWDFRAFYLGSRHYLAGVSPYPGHSLAALALKQGFVYPAPMAALLAPFALLPYPLAVSLWFALSAGAIAGALRLLGVRDWRCLGAVLLTQPAEQALRLGTLMPVLTLLLALLWKYRDRVGTGASLAAVLVVSKLFLLPMLAWLVVTRRLKTAVLASALAVTVCVLGWLPIHLSTVASYPSLLRALAAYEQTFSYSLTSLGVALGLSATAATLVAVAAAMGLLVWAVSARENDFLAFRLALAASFVLCPIVWGHYYVLLIVPLAVTRPRLSALWLAAIWIKPDTLLLRNSAVWVAFALLILFAQLDLVPSLTRWWNRQQWPRIRQVAALSAAAGLLASTAAAAQAGQTGTAPLRPVSSGVDASGVAAIRLDRARRQLCWRLWIDDFPPQRAAIKLWTPGAEAKAKPLLGHTGIGRDGQSQGCARLGRHEFPLDQRQPGHSSRYLLSLTAPNGTSLKAALQLANPRLPRRHLAYEGRLHHR